MNHAHITNLVAPANATHVAVNSGSWFDPATWQGGAIPVAGARVVIPLGLDVSYDGVSDVEIFTLGVMGNLSFATQVDTKLVVDTFVVGHDGKLTIGTADNPIADDVTTDIVFANNGAIDVAWDPHLVSRGLVALGEVEIHGAEKSAHHKVSIDPMAGDTTLTLDEVPTNWEVGDTIVIAGSRFDGHKWDNEIRAVRYHGTEDEVRTITSIDGGVVGLDAALVHDHDTLRADLKVSVANYTRNITFASEDGAGVSERGHVMLHSRESDIRYAAFDDLGRTDKSTSALDVSAFGSNLQSDSNIQGRYSLHFHSNGVDAPENPSMAVGNAIFGSPGWGLVHHNSTVLVHNNATYDTFGAAYVAETGNELGAWTDNIAIKAEGVGNGNPKNFVSLENYDMANTGDGFWFQGRLVQAEGNVAAGVTHGYTYFHRGANTDDPSVRANINLQEGQFQLTEALDGRSRITVDDAPIMAFHNNETFASHQGLIVVKANPNQGHDIHSEFTDFKAWAVQSGAHFEYTSHYRVTDFDVVAKEDTAFSSSRIGISVGNNTSDFVIVDAKVDGFNDGGISLSHHWTASNPPRTLEQKQFVVVNPTFSNLGAGAAEIVEFDPNHDVLITGAVSPVPLSINLSGPLTYQHTYNVPGSRVVEITGTKTDSLGTVSIPAGSDSYNLSMSQVIHILETDGYFTTTDGQAVFFAQLYFKDRSTGEISKLSLPVFLNDDVPLGNQYFSFRDAVDRGVVDLSNAAPITADEVVTVDAGVDTVIDLTANDSDPEGNPVTLDGIVPPVEGQIFDNLDGTVTFRPSPDYTGTETLKYWVSDGAGNLTPAFLTVTVEAATDQTPIVGTEGEDTLRGGVGDETLEGLGGDDLLDGGAGNDLMRGGDGDDTFVVRDAGDIVVEDISASGGRDRVEAKVDYTLPAGEKVELLLARAGGATGLRLEGNELRNDIRGNAADDTLLGADGNDVLRGKGGANELFGGAGNDRLYATAGENTLTGGAGNDIFYIRDADTTVIEGADGGHDIALSRVDYTLTAGAEVEVLGINADMGGVRLVGNAYDQLMRSAGGDDTLDGGAGGSDTYRGNGGSDTFVFNTGWGYDRILDFTDGSDLIDMSAVGINSISAFDDIRQVGANVRIEEGEDVLVLTNVALATLGKEDFIFIS